MKPIECAHCGEQFKSLKDGFIPTHDYPRPCRVVCRGSGERPRKGPESPLWKDEPDQQAKDFFQDARQELLVYGFAVVKQMGVFTGERTGETQCPLCGKRVDWSIAESNGHCWAKCETSGCIHANE